jgi:hypothetical protein
MVLQALAGAAATTTQIARGDGGSRARRRPVRHPRGARKRRTHAWQQLAGLPHQRRLPCMAAARIVGREIWIEDRRWRRVRSRRGRIAGRRAGSIHSSLIGTYCTVDDKKTKVTVLLGALPTTSTALQCTAGTRTSVIKFAEERAPPTRVLPST